MAEIISLHVNEMQHIIKVIERTRRTDVNIISLRNAKRTLNLCEYMIQYPYITEEIMAYLKVAENLYRKIEEARKQLQIYSGILEHQKIKGEI